MSHQDVLAVDAWSCQDAVNLPVFQDDEDFHPSRLSARVAILVTVVMSVSLWSTLSVLVVSALT